MADPIIESINVRMGDKTVKLTIEQARQLKDNLLKLFGELAQPAIIGPVVAPPVFIDRYIPYTPLPFIPWRPQYENPNIFYSAHNNSATLCLSE